MATKKEKNSITDYQVFDYKGKHCRRVVALTTDENTGEAVYKVSNEVRDERTGYYKSIADYTYPETPDEKTLENDFKTSFFVYKSLILIFLFILGLGLTLGFGLLIRFLIVVASQNPETAIEVLQSIAVFGTSMFVATILIKLYRQLF